MLTAGKAQTRWCVNAQHHLHGVSAVLLLCRVELGLVSPKTRNPSSVTPWIRHEIRKRALFLKYKLHFWKSLWEEGSHTNSALVCYEITESFRQERSNPALPSPPLHHIPEFLGLLQKDAAHTSKKCPFNKNWAAVGYRRWHLCKTGEEPTGVSVCSWLQKKSSPC